MVRENRMLVRESRMLVRENRTFVGENRTLHSNNTLTCNSVTEWPAPIEIEKSFS